MGNWGTPAPSNRTKMMAECYGEVVRSGSVTATATLSSITCSYQRWRMAGIGHFGTSPDGCLVETVEVLAVIIWVHSSTPN